MIAVAGGIILAIVFLFFLPLLITMFLWLLLPAIGLFGGLVLGLAIEPDLAGWFALGGCVMGFLGSFQWLGE